MHGISLPPGEFGGPWIDRLFTNALPADVHPYFTEVCSMRVSSHLVVRRDGAVTQYVKFTERAWHAGQSIYQGREACNDFSVGVELEGTDTLPYPPAAHRRPQRYCPRTQDRPRTGIRLAAGAAADRHCGACRENPKEVVGFPQAPGRMTRVEKLKRW